MTRTRSVAQRAIMLELAMSVLLRCRSLPIVSFRSAALWSGEAQKQRGDYLRGKAYQDQNATKKPNHEKKNTRPYMLITLKKGIERALWLTGFTAGALKSTPRSNMMATFSS